MLISHLVNNASVFVPSLSKVGGGQLALNTSNFRSAGVGSNISHPASKSPHFGQPLDLMLGQ